MSTRQRAILLDWLLEVEDHIGNDSSISWLMAVQIVDHILKQEQIVLTKLQLLGMASYFLAQKMLDNMYEDSSFWKMISDNTYSTNDLVEMEVHIIKQLVNSQFDFVKPYFFLFVRPCERLVDSESCGRCFDSKTHFLQPEMIQNEVCPNCCRSHNRLLYMMFQHFTLRLGVLCDKSIESQLVLLHTAYCLVFVMCHGAKTMTKQKLEGYIYYIPDIRDILVSLDQANESLNTARFVNNKARKTGLNQTSVHLLNHQTFETLVKQTCSILESNDSHQSYTNDKGDKNDTKNAKCCCEYPFKLRTFPVCPFQQLPRVTDASSLIGQGTFGSVYKQNGTDKETHAHVIKYWKLDEDGSLTDNIVRELFMLYRFQHSPYIGKVTRWYNQQDSNQQDFKYNSKSYCCFQAPRRDGDLHTYIQNLKPQDKRSRLMPVKAILFQLLVAVELLHDEHITHRDIKPRNILVTTKSDLTPFCEESEQSERFEESQSDNENKHDNQNQTKSEESKEPEERPQVQTVQVELIDFGSAGMSMNYRTCSLSYYFTLWYRPPEVLMGGPLLRAGDVWSVGCVMAELYNLEPLFPGDCEIDQMFQIFKRLGTPDEKHCEHYMNYKHYKTTYPKWKPQPIREWLKTDDTLALDLCGRLLCMDERQRITAKEALNHPYFSIGFDKNNPQQCVC